MKKVFFIVFLVLFLFPLTTAQVQQTLGGIDGFEPGVDISLTQTCANCTFINISYVQIANGTNLLVNSEMSKDGTFYNLTLSGVHTTSTGEYIVNWFANPDATGTAGNYNFFVRNNGSLLTTAEAIVLIFQILFSALISAFFLYFGFILPYTSNRNPHGSITRLVSMKYLKLLSLWIGYGAMLWFLNMVSGVANNFISLSLVGSLMTALYVFMATIGVGLTFLILGILFIESWKDILIPLFQKVLPILTRRRK